MPALIIGGRWAKGLGTSGIVADDAREDVARGFDDGLRRMAALEALNEDLASERAELWELLEVETRPR